MKAESWRKLSVWRRYVPEVLPLEPSQQGSPNVLMVLRLIEESPVSPHFPVHSGVPKERGMTFLVYADSCGLKTAFLGNGGRNAATIFSLRYSSAR